MVYCQSAYKNSANNKNQNKKNHQDFFVLISNDRSYRKSAYKNSTKNYNQNK